MMAIANLQYAWTPLTTPLTKSFGASLAASQVVFAAFILVETWLVPVEGVLVDSFGPRVVVICGGDRRRLRRGHRSDGRPDREHDPDRGIWSHLRRLEDHPGSRRDAHGLLHHPTASRLGAGGLGSQRADHPGAGQYVGGGHDTGPDDSPARLLGHLLHEDPHGLQRLGDHGTGLPHCQVLPRGQGHPGLRHERPGPGHPDRADLERRHPAVTADLFGKKYAR